MQGVMEQILQGIFLIALLGVIFVVLFQVVKALGGLFLIGLIGGILFMEIYGIYLFFTERYLYVEDLHLEFHLFLYYLQYSACSRSCGKGS